MKSVKQAWSVVLGGAFALLAVAAVYFFAAERAREDIHAAAGRQLQIIALDLESVLERFETLPYTLSVHPDLVQALERPDDAALVRHVNHILRSIQRKARVSAIYLMDATGLTLASSNWQDPMSFVGRNFAFRPYFAEAMAGRAGRFYGIGNATGEPGYFITQPVYLGEGEGNTPSGVIAVKISLEEFAQTWRSSEEPIALADQRGVVFLSNRPAWRYHSLRPLDAPDQQRLAGTLQYAGQQILPIAMLSEGVGDAGQRVARPVGRLGWELMLFPSPSRVTRAALVPAVATALLLTLATLAWWALLQRRRRMEERSESRRALQRAADELEHKIAERTAELEAKYAKLQQAEQLLRSTQGELVQAGKLAMLGQMAAGITHELNQPLAAIRAFADNAVTFLARGRTDKAQENLEHISAASARMGSLVGQLKGFARKSGDPVAGVDLVQAVRASAVILESEFRRHDVRLETEVPPALVVLGDSVRVEQVLINLLHNALDAVEGRAERRVGLVLAEEDGAAVIRIRDSGPGIPEQVARHLFEPFFTTKPSGKGLGLGLAISSSIVQAMNGRLDARNLESGGAEFVLRLPLPHHVNNGETVAS